MGFQGGPFWTSIMDVPGGTKWRVSARPRLRYGASEGHSGLKREPAGQVGWQPLLEAKRPPNTWQPTVLE